MSSLTTHNIDTPLLRKMVLTFDQIQARSAGIALPQ